MIMKFSVCLRFLMMFLVFVGLIFFDWLVFGVVRGCLVCFIRNCMIGFVGICRVIVGKFDVVRL